MRMEASNFFFHGPGGPIVGWLDGEGLRRLRTCNPAFTDPAALGETTPSPLAESLAAALTRYFAGTPEDFAAIPLRGEGSEFQHRVWTAARGVAWGQTATYGELCERMGLGTTHARAVGTALGSNPIHLLIPCHRFLGANGSLTGYAGGLAWKRALLECEGSLLKTGA